MVKIRITFIAAFISISLFICAIIGILTCSGFNAYTSNTKYLWFKNVYENLGEQIALDCVDILDKNTYNRAIEKITEKYGSTDYGICISTPAHVSKTPNYTSSIIFEETFTFSHTYFNDFIYYYDGVGDDYIDISVSLPYSEDFPFAKLWESRYSFIVTAIITGSIFTALILLFKHFSKNTPLKSFKFLQKLPSYLYLLIDAGTIITLIIFLYLCNRFTFDNIYLFDAIIILPIVILALTFTIFSCGIMKRINEKQFYNSLFITVIGQKHGILGQALVLCTYLIILVIATALLSHYVWSFAWLILIAFIAVLGILHIKNISTLSGLIENYCNGNWSKLPDTEPVLLNSISGKLYKLSASMQATVEKSVRNERTKTELITNVSHDIKTPLTSIINYTELLKGENLSDEQRDEYLKVLSKNSSRMKKLIEDLIEASKAATGNIELHPMECSIDTLLSQAIAEREPDAALRNLKFVFVKQRDPVFLTIDGEKLYRVFDNLLSNTVKYSLPGSRIYIDLSNNDKVNIEFKNITEDQITISPEELTERFVKGDMSRNSEGSGLGLAICKNLVELMGGTIKLEIDGDQFMVRLSFPVAE